ncbi:hypothetical protein N7495_008407 [Penicillium taxi]|uniref:uncharacterized protein n=1 Tax=Penicillium taxi TaxID=168475 RepID=UPI002545BC21|nr:uncharacterized protein N7495_008407 [Penicillium taxi]KAJ5888366.1 hypothetical protein N7495_008407 [Penicillium taxi]
MYTVALLAAMIFLGMPAHAKLPLAKYNNEANKEIENRAVIEMATATILPDSPSGVVTFGPMVVLSVATTVSLDPVASALCSACPSKTVTVTVCPTLPPACPKVEACPKIEAYPSTPSSFSSARPFSSATSSSSARSSSATPSSSARLSSTPLSRATSSAVPSSSSAKASLSPGML